MPTDDGYIDNFIRVWTSGVAISVRGMGLLLGSRWTPPARAPHARDGRAGRDVQRSRLPRVGRIPPGVDPVNRPMWTDFDVLLTPTLAQPPLKVGALAPKDGPVRRWAGSKTPPASVQCAPIWNATGQPAVSLPLHHSDGRACRSASSSSAHPPARRCCCRSQRSWSRRGPWAQSPA